MSGSSEAPRVRRPDRSAATGAPPVAKHGVERRLRFATVLAAASLAMAVSPEVVWAQAKMYWSDEGSTDIKRADLDGTNVEPLIAGLNSPRSIAVDGAGAGKMYWTDSGNKTVERADLDGTNPETLITGLDQPQGIAVDSAAGKLYWLETGQGEVRRADLDGTNTETLLTGLSNPGWIDLDVAGAKMYWTDFGSGEVRRANLDGSSNELLVSGLSFPQGIAVDSGGGKIYWTDSSDKKIQRADLDGTNVEDLITTGVDAIKGIDIDVEAGKMYWTDSGFDKIQRADLDGTNVEDVLTTGLTDPSGIAVIRPVLEQIHYRWRNDDGSEAAATWAAAEDTLLIDVRKLGLRRLRIAISNEGRGPDVGTDVSPPDMPRERTWTAASGLIRIHYTTHAGSPHAVLGGDEPAGSVPAYVERVEAALSETLRLLVDDLGFQSPVGHPFIDVYLADLGPGVHGQLDPPVLW